MTSKLTAVLLVFALTLAAQDKNYFPKPSYFRETFSMPVTKVELQAPVRLSDYVVGGKLELSLRAYLELVMANNTDIAISRLTVETAKNAIQRGFAIFDPLATASFNSQRTKSLPTDALAGATTLQQLSQPLRFDYTQLMPSGTSYTIGFAETKSTSNSGFQNFNPSFTSNLSFNFSQPLLRNRGSFINRLAVTQARSRLVKSEYDLKTNLISMISTAELVYWQAIQVRENLRVQESALDLADKFLQRSRRELELGAISKLDIYQPEQQFVQAQASVAQARYQVLQQDDAIRRQIGADLDPNIRVLPIELTEAIAPPTNGTAVDAEGLITKAVSLRPDLKSASQNLDLDELQIRSATNALRPDLALTGIYTSQGRGGTAFVRRNVFDDVGDTSVVTQIIPGRNNQDQVELLKARYAVRRAELEVKRNELISPIDATKNALNLEETRRRLKQLESDIQSRQAQSQAELAVLREKRNRSMIDVGRERQRIAQAKLLSPITGLVAIRQNRGGFQGSFGQQVPDIREGDTLQPGTPVAEILDLSEMEIIAKVGELDRANLHEGQEVKFQLDALPDQTFHGKIKGMSGTATADPFNGDPAKKFDVIFSVDMKELMTVLGASPEQIRKVQETAVRNAKTAPARSFMPSSLSQPDGAPGGPQGLIAGAPGMPSLLGMQSPGGGGGETPDNNAGGQRGFRGGGAGLGGAGARGGGDRMAMMMAQLPDAVKKDIEKALKGKKLEDLSREDRAPIMAKIREAMGGAMSGRGGRGDGPGGGGGGFAATGLINGTTEAEREAARLPLPPEEDSQLDVLLRPGLLADVEIIVDKVADAIYVPPQAVLEKGGRTVVFVENPATHRFEERVVRLAKRSESAIVIADGLKPDEIIALGDPTAQKNNNNKAADATKSMGAMPAAGAAAGKGK